ncbi:FmdB family zinc ribbon protein [Solimonas terrae]|uniref:Zinc ribbon domain-containing protein n=1 Tax=Solimonas terrae TaxID=1396819 RepID=A0A6M2BLF1_9GAMM|nr:zinc ribbon domain-containing protein [Solimonas terrae]NGY03496.1 zinc ribbon domain-containing protein [Solimonas terrae]
MPIYDYHCTACKADSEILHKISDPPETICPECGQPALVKQVSAAGFRLSGGGWYETDFKSGGKKNLAGEQSGDKPAATKADDSAKTETKKADSPASAPAAKAGDSKPAASGKGEASA